MSNLDQAKLEKLQKQLIGNIGGAVGLLMAYMGDQASVYKVLDEIGPCGSSELAKKFGSPLGTIKSRLRLIYESLRKAEDLKPLGGADE